MAEQQNPSKGSTPKLTPQQQQAQEARAQVEANQRRLREEAQGRQLKVPSQPTPEPPPSAPSRLTWHERAEAHLEEKGWDRCGVNWRGQTLWSDPAARAAVEERVFVRMVPTDNGDVPLHQLKVPVRRWEYCTEEAHGIQRDRERAAAELKATLPAQPQPTGAAPVPDRVNQAGQAAGAMAGVA